MADRRSQAEKLAAMAAASESPNEAAIAAAKLAGGGHSAPRSNTLAFATFAPPSEHKARPFTDPDSDVVVVFISDDPEEVVVTDYGPFACRSAPPIHAGEWGGLRG